MERKTFHEAFDKWLYENKKLAEVSKEYLTKMLEKAPNKTIEINYDYTVSVCYDGGNHPEYNSNCYSEVHSVKLKDGDIYLETEDCDEYDFENINAEEQSAVTFAVEYAVDNMDEC
jgi:hypothetical protein